MPSTCTLHVGVEFNGSDKRCRRLTNTAAPARTSTVLETHDIGRIPMATQGYTSGAIG